MMIAALSAAAFVFALVACLALYIVKSVLLGIWRLFVPAGKWG